MKRNGWNIDAGKNLYWKKKDEGESWYLAKDNEDGGIPESLDDPVIASLEDEVGTQIEMKRYATFREFVDTQLAKYEDLFEGQGEIKAEGTKEEEPKGEKPGEVTGGERAPEGEKPAEPQGETKPEKPEKKESKQDKAVKAFDELSTKTRDETGKQAHAIVDHEAAGPYGRLVDEVRNILIDMTKSVKTMKGSPKEVQRAVENAVSILGESQKWMDQITDEVKELGQKMAEAFNGLTVYNKAQWLAREVSDAVGEGRFKDAATYLYKIKARIDKGNADYSKWAMSFKANEDGTLKPSTPPSRRGESSSGARPSADHGQTALSPLAEPRRTSRICPTRSGRRRS
jgi:hypothetical protein